MPTEPFPSFPFGTDFTQIEQQLLPAMQYLADHAARPAQLAALIARGLRGGQPDEAELAALERMVEITNEKVVEDNDDEKESG